MFFKNNKITDPILNTIDIILNKTKGGIAVVICKEHKFKIINLEYVKNRGACYGDTFDESYWDLTIDCEGVRENFFTDWFYDNHIDNIYKMFDDMLALDIWWEE